MRKLSLTLLLILSAAGGGCKKNDNAAGRGQALDFRLETLQHKRFYLNEHRGRPVVLVFWSTWCTICKKELVDFKELTTDERLKNVVFASVCNDPDNLTEVKNIADSLGIKLPILLDENAGLFNRLKLTGVPATVVIDPEGKVDYIYAGYDRGTLGQLKKRLENFPGQAGAK